MTFFRLIRFLILKKEIFLHEMLYTYFFPSIQLNELPRSKLRSITGSGTSNRSKLREINPGEIQLKIFNI
jgi:hypothetical protein